MVILLFEAGEEQDYRRRCGAPPVQGVTNAAVKRMVREGHLSGQCRRGGNRHFTAVDPQAIELAIARRASSVGVAELADRLGVSRFQIRMLRRSGLLCPFADARRQ